MAELTVDRTYGNALFEAASELDRIEEVEEELKALSEIFDENPSMVSLLNDPTFSAAEKKEVVRKIFEGRIMPEMLNFLYILIDKGRTRHFQRIAREYQKLRNQEEGFVAGTIYSVQPLAAPQLAKLEEDTEKLIGRKVKLENKLDPSLLGGVRILADGRLIDASLKKRLESLGSQMLM